MERCFSLHSLVSHFSQKYRCCICIHTYVYVHVCIYILIYLYTYVYMYVCMYTFIQRHSMLMQVCKKHKWQHGSTVFLISLSSTLYSIHQPILTLLPKYVQNLTTSQHLHFYYHCGLSHFLMEIFWYLFNWSPCFSCCPSLPTQKPE